ncbi:MAG: hypothetical protein EBU90_23520 [Proteobacteria bacterium]|nr:hypothetical protein [Pseudomonadota bacterium]
MSSSRRKNVGDLVVPIGTWDILLFDENAELGYTIHWKPEHVALIIGMKTLNDSGGRTRLVEVLTPNGAGWCYLSEAQKVR